MQIPSPSATPPKQEPAALPALREDLKLYPGARHRDGSPSWRISDPVRNAFFEIGWLEFELLARWMQHETAESLVEEVADQTLLNPSEEEVQDLIRFLAENQLLAPSSEVARKTLAQKRATSASRAWYEYVFHHYLFFRVPLFRPDAFLARTVDFTEVFFTRTFFAVIFVLLGVDLYLVSREWHEFSAAIVRLLTPQGFLYYAIAVSFAKVIHELGHAYAAKRYGVRVPAMGVAFLILWPYLYTDVAETWKLSDRRKQFVISVAGMAAELSLAVIATLLWALSPEGASKEVFFVLATTTWVMTLVINASPFMRFDGYFLLSDILDFPNLHERSFACARWWLRTTFFRLPEPLPEPQLRPGQRRWLVVFAWTTWIYRLVVFIGIALLVYFMFYKLLGIAMMVLELFWFIVRPIGRELGYLVERRRDLRLATTPFLLLVAVALAGLWLVPVSSTLVAPGLLRSAQEQHVYAPFSGRITAIGVEERFNVLPGAMLVMLQADELKLRRAKAQVALTSARTELSRVPASIGQQERQAVLEEELASATASMRAVDREEAQQTLVAAQFGRVVDIPKDLTVGRWVNPRQLLMRVVTDQVPVIEAFVNERQIGAIKARQSVTFYPSQPNLPVLHGEIIAVDKSPVKELTHAVMASTHGGDVLVNPTKQGALSTQDGVFKVTIRPYEPVPAVQSVIRGTVRVEADLRFVAENFLYRALSVLIRESGI